MALATTVYPDDPRVIVPVAELFQGLAPKIKFKPGFTNKDIVSDGGTTRVYSAILFKLVDLMIRDVIAGDLVYFDNKVKSMFYVEMLPASKETILGDYLKEDMTDTLVDFHKTGYKLPYIFFDPGYKHSTLAKCKIPLYLYTLLVSAVNKGKRFPRSSKSIARPRYEG